MATSNKDGLLGAARKSSAGISLGKKLFDPNLQTSIQPTQITHILKTIGFDIPPSVQISADVAQIIMSGGALSKAIDASKDLDAIMMPSVSIMSSVLDIFEVAGILDPNSPGAQVMTFGLDAALVVSSGGLNVFADIAFVFDILKGIFGAEDTRSTITRQVQSQSQSALRTWYNARETQESKAAAVAFQNYHSGQLSIFQYIAKVADVAPDKFIGYFPDFQGFIPVSTLSHCETVTKEAHYGGFLGIGRTYVSEHATSCIDIQNELMMSKDPAQFVMQMQNVFLDKYILSPFHPYVALSSMTKDQVNINGFPPNAEALGCHTELERLNSGPIYPRIRPFDLALLSLLPPYASYIHDDFDIKQLLRKYLITPSDLGYTVIADSFRTGRYSVVKAEEPAGLTINGLAVFTDPKVMATNADSKDWDLEQTLAIKYDENHDIENLLTLKNASATVTEWGIMPSFNGRYEGKLPGSYANIPLTSPMGYRNIQNFWSAISMLDKMKSDPYFKTANFDRFASFFPSRDALEKKHQAVQAKIVGRTLNHMAKANIASFYGTTPEKLQFRTPKPGQLAAVIN